MSAPDAAASVTVLDNRRAPCAVGIIRAADAMKAVAPGAVLQVMSRDHFAPVEIPLWAEREGHEVAFTRRDGLWPRRHWLFQIIKRPLEKPATLA